MQGTCRVEDCMQGACKACRGMGVEGRMARKHLLGESGIVSRFVLCASYVVHTGCIQGARSFVHKLVTGRVVARDRAEVVARDRAEVVARDGAEVVARDRAAGRVAGRWSRAWGSARYLEGVYMVHNNGPWARCPPPSLRNAVRLLASMRASGKGYLGVLVYLSLYSAPALSISFLYPFVPGSSPLHVPLCLSWGGGSV